MAGCKRRARFCATHMPGVAIAVVDFFALFQANTVAQIVGSNPWPSERSHPVGRDQGVSNAFDSDVNAGVGAIL